MDLISPVSGYQNEKQVTTPIVRNGHVIFTTVILNGARLDEAPFDINNDGKFDDQDLIPGTDANGDTIYIPPSGLASRTAWASCSRRAWATAIATRGRCSTNTCRALRAAFSASRKALAWARPPAILAADTVRTTMQSKQHGVALMELMAVVAIIGIIVAIAYPS